MSVEDKLAEDFKSVLNLDKIAGIERIDVEKADQIESSEVLFRSLEAKKKINLIRRS